HAGPLAGGVGLLVLVGGDVDIDDLEPVEEVLDVRALDDDVGAVPLAGGAGDVGGARDDVVEGAGAGLGLLAVGVVGVVEDLVLEAGLPRVVLVFGRAVDDPAVGALGGAPVDLELEVGVLLGGADVAAGLVHAEDAVFHRPAFIGERVLPEPLPAVGGLAVEEEFPPVPLLGVRQRVGRGGVVPRRREGDLAGGGPLGAAAQQRLELRVCDRTHG